MTENKKAKSAYRLVRKYRLSAQVLFSLAVLLAFVVTAIFADVIAPYRATGTAERGSVIFEKPSTRHLLGTTYIGRDVFSQVVVGTRASLLIGLSTAFLATSTGAILGLLAGFFGGRIETLIMRTVDFFYAIPSRAFIIILVIALGNSVVALILAMSAMFWRSPTRVVRAETMVLKKNDFIEAARAIGAEELSILLRHVLPNMVPMILVYFAITLGYAMIAEATISFLGFGAAGSLSWGKMLNLAFQTGGLSRGAWWWIVPPGLCIALFVNSVFNVSTWLGSMLKVRRVSTL